MKTVRLTAAQAMVRWLSAQKTEAGDSFIAGCWAIFGHGNVAGLGEALYGVRDVLPTYRWTHLAGTYGRGRMCLYVDGKLVASEPASGPVVLPDRDTRRRFA